MGTNNPGDSFESQFGKNNPTAAAAELGYDPTKANTIVAVIVLMCYLAIFARFCVFRLFNGGAERQTINLKFCNWFVLTGFSPIMKAFVVWFQELLSFLFCALAGRDSKTITALALLWTPFVQAACVTATLEVFEPCLKCFWSVFMGDRGAISQSIGPERLTAHQRWCIKIIHTHAGMATINGFFVIIFWGAAFRATFNTATSFLELTMNERVAFVWLIMTRVPSLYGTFKLLVSPFVWCTSGLEGYQRWAFDVFSEKAFVDGDAIYRGRFFFVPGLWPCASAGDTLGQTFSDGTICQAMPEGHGHSVQPQVVGHGRV